MKFSLIENLYVVLKEIQEKEMPIKLSYKFSKLLSAVETDYEFFFSQIKKILNKYAKKDDDGNIIYNEKTVPIREDCRDLADKALQELYNTDISLPQIVFTLDELEDLKIKPSELKTLLPFIKE